MSKDTFSCEVAQMFSSVSLESGPILMNFSAVTWNISKILVNFTLKYIIQARIGKMI